MASVEAAPEPPHCLPGAVTTASKRSTGRRRAYSDLGVAGGFPNGLSAGLPGRGSSQMRLNSPIKSVVLAVGWSRLDGSPSAAAGLLNR